MIFEFNQMEQFIFILMIIEYKIKYSYCIYRVLFEIPISLFGLFLYWERRIVNASILEIVLFRFLYFNNEPLSRLAYTIKIKYCLSI